MKNLVSHVTLICLIVSSFPMLPNVAFATNCNSPIHFEKRKSCDGTPDDNPILKWSEERCDCVENENAENFNNQFNNCAENKEIDETERMNCYMSNALGESGLSSCGGFLESDDTLKSSSQLDTENYGNCMDSIGLPSSAENWTSRMSMINAVLSIIMFFGFNNEKNDNNMCSSAKWMIAASILGVVNEIVNYFLFESDLRDLQVEFFDQVLCDTSLSKDPESFSSTISSKNETDVSGGCVGKDPLQAQVDAFNYLVKERSLSSELHFKKFIGYLATGGLYLVAIGIGIYDIVSSVGAKTTLNCFNVKPTSSMSNGATKFIAQIIENLSSKFLITNATAESNSFQSNLTSGELSGFDHFFKVKRYSCINKENCGVFDKCQEDNTEYNNCMKCMRNSISGKLNSESEAKSEASGIDCTKYERGILESPLLYQLIVGGAAVGLGVWFAVVNKLNAFGGILIGQIIISAIASVLAFISAHHNYVAFEEAKRQAGLIEGVQEEFIGAIVLNCPNGREDPNVLECFCFNEDGSRKENRTQSQACQSLFQNLDKQFTIESHDLKIGQKTIKPNCITIDGNPDPECNCQKFTDSKTGRNACFQVPITSGNIGNILTGTGADQISKTANALTGSGASNEIGNPSGLLNAAKNLTDVSKKLLGKLNNTLRQKNQGTIDINQQKLAAVGQSIATPNFLSTLKKSSPTNQFESTRNAVLTQAKEKIKKVSAEFSGGNKLAFNQPKNKKEGMNFDFSQNENANKTKNFMEKNYNYNKDDIIKNDSASIWKIITNRYNNSGYSRLFEE